MIPFRLHSPVTGERLDADTPHSLKDATGARWPVIDGIPYLRTGREELVDRALAALDRGRTEEALLALLPDQDEWWRGERPSPDDLTRLIRDRDALSLREALDLLAFGPVADYFLNRWSDPTFLAGLALLEAHWNAPRCVFELACGIGHYLRELQMRGFVVSGADVVFAKLWVARHWVLGPKPQLVCFDAASGWPIEDAPVDLVMCNDAFYFLEPKGEILDRMRETAGEDGWIAVSHIHNRDNPGFSAGSAMTAVELEELFPDALVYDDAELTRALLEARAPVPASPHALRGAEAFSVIAGPGCRPAPRAVKDGLALPPPGAPLKRNPLYRPEGDDYAVHWPSERYRQEYAARATYPAHSHAPDEAVAGPEVEAMARRRELVNLPERW